MTDTIARARATADKVRHLAEIVDKLAWNLDAEISALDKDDAGYREKSAANPDGAANAIPGDLEAALFQAEAWLIDVAKWAEQAHLEPQAVAIGGTYGAWYRADLKGLDEALKAQRQYQLMGTVRPLRIVRGA